jgi:hypothetical protein
MLTEQQQIFLDLLYEDGLPVDLMKSAKEAFVKAGFTGKDRAAVYRLVRKLKKEIIERNIEYMVLHSAECINALQDLVRTPTKPGAKYIISAANSILDRGGFGKKESQELEIKAHQGIVVLPAKKQ